MHNICVENKLIYSQLTYESNSKQANVTSGYRSKNFGAQKNKHPAKQCTLCDQSSNDLF